MCSGRSCREKTGAGGPGGGQTAPRENPAAREGAGNGPSREPARTTLAFTGDIGFDHYMARKWEDQKLIDGEILAILGASDHVVANLEGPLVSPDAPRAHAAEERLMHTIDPAATRVLRAMRADIWSLGNNHIMDAGESGLAATLGEAERFGARTIGAGMNLRAARTPVLLGEAGGIGLFGVGYRRGCKPADEGKGGCFLWNEMGLIRETIAQIKAKCRWCVMVVHGGEEFTALPSPYTRERCLAYLAMGADAVVCHHPHVPMNYEKAGDKTIFYSLGNFIFDTPYQRAQFHTDEGILLQLHFTERECSFTAHGIRVDRETERIRPGKLPPVFADVPPAEYEKLAPLAAKMFLAATKRQQRFLHPERWRNAAEEDWTAHFLDPARPGRVEGEALDFRILHPLAHEAEKGAWKASALEAVKSYLLEQL